METNKITEQIIGCAYRVHSELQGGFLERVYENAMAHELGKVGLKFEQQKPLDVYYDGVVVGKYFVDLFVEDQVVVEFKAVQKFNDAHKAQTLHYMKATNSKIGLLINFGRSVEIKRLINSK